MVVVHLYSSLSKIKVQRKGSYFNSDLGSFNICCQIFDKNRLNLFELIMIEAIKSRGIA